MNDDLEQTILDLKTPGLNNPETYILTHIKINNYTVLIFTNFKKAQIYKIPYRKSPHQGIEILTCFDYLDFYRPNNNGSFLFKIEDKNIFMWEKNYSVLKQMVKLKIFFRAWI